MKILYVITSTDVGGAEKSLVSLVQALGSRHTMRVVSLKKCGPLAAELKAAGVSVTSLEMTGAGLGCVSKLTREIETFQPDVVHFNNIHYHLTPSVILAADRFRRETGKPVKLLYTAHDYQLVCPGHGLFDGAYRLCEDCLGGSFCSCIRRRCVKGSYAKSALAALEAYLWRGSRAYGAIDRIICCSAYLKEKN